VRITAVCVVVNARSRQVKLSRAALTALLMLVAVAGVAAAGPFEDGRAALDRGDYVTAYRLLRPLAEQGDVRAQNDLGSMYQDGKGVPQNYTGAMKWYRRAAEQNYATSQFNVGLMYEHA
jgi:uncharacterized protein